MERLKEGLNGPHGKKQKTAFLRDLIHEQHYSRRPIENVVNRSKTGVRAVIMGMSGMLDCANNFHFKYKRKSCDVCKVIDDESHRINHCKKFAHINLYNSELKFDFQTIYSDKRSDVDKVEYVIRQLWDLSNGKNSMK